MLRNYLYLIVAILFEVVATTALKETHGFTRLGPSLVSIAGYALAFYFLSLPLRAMPVGIVYALWCAAGIVLITAIGWIWLVPAGARHAGSGRYRPYHGRGGGDQSVFKDRGALRQGSSAAGSLLRKGVCSVK